MTTIEIKIPEGIRYLSEWKDFDNLPNDKHYILNKEICGCGATEAFIRSNEPLIIAMPRKHLLFNKYSQHLGDNVFLYRFIDQKQYFSEKSPNSEDLKKFDVLFCDYIRNGGRKILTTYDSLDKIVDLLCKEGVEINQFRVVVDEFQQIIGDAPFKAAIEHKFYSTLKKFKSVVYLSATPFLQSYLEKTKQFRDLPIIQLKWPETSVKKAEIRTFKLKKSITEKCCEIIKDYKNGNSPYVIIDGNRIESNEAVFFLNDIKAIISVIKKAGLTPDEVNILCAPRKENYERINSLNKGKDADEPKFSRGIIPAKGEPHKMYTFCTSTVYIGADFNSTNAFSYIFANPNVESLAIDVSTDIQQIIGRQRLDENPFRMKAHLYYYLKKPFVSEEDMNNIIEAKRLETKKHIENYDNAKHKDTQLKSIEALIVRGHNDQYCCISEDEHGNKSVVENDLIAIAEKRAWDIANVVYSGDMSLFKALKKSVNIINDVDTANPDVKKIFKEWTKDGLFERQAKLYCELREQFPDLLNQCGSFIPKYFHEYYDALGRRGFEYFQWRQGAIKDALKPTPIDQIPHNQIVSQLISKFAEGGEYPKEDIKKALTDIYQRLGVKGKPSASDIQRYFTIAETSKRINKKKTAMIRIISHWQKRISLFRSITCVRSPQENTDIDKALDLIKTGNSFGLRGRIAELRRITNKEKFDEYKSKLPVVTWNGTFRYRDTTGCSNYSSFTAIDFDHITDMKKLTDWLESIACVYAYFRTPSGKGVKAIILHDNIKPENHADLYQQLLVKFNNEFTDKSTCDLGRGNYLSYDPDLWINPDVEPFHYEPSAEDIEVAKTQTIVKGKNGEATIEEDGDDTSRFLFKLSKIILTDESIINILRKNWTQQSLTRGRNNTALSYGGVLCKAGVDERMAIDFIKELIPDLPLYEVERAVGYAYKHNIFGSNRKDYIRRKR